MTPSIKTLLIVTFLVFMFFPTYKVAESLCSRGPKDFNLGDCATKYESSWPGNGFVLAWSILNPNNSFYEPEPGTYIVSTKDDFGSLRATGIIKPYFAAGVAVVAGVLSFFTVLIGQEIKNRNRNKK